MDKARALSILKQLTVHLPEIKEVLGERWPDFSRQIRAHTRPFAYLAYATETSFWREILLTEPDESNQMALKWMVLRLKLSRILRTVAQYLVVRLRLARIFRGVAQIEELLDRLFNKLWPFPEIPGLDPADETNEAIKEAFEISDELYEKILAQAIERLLALFEADEVVRKIIRRPRPEVTGVRQQPQPPAETEVSLQTIAHRFYQFCDNPERVAKRAD